MQTASYYFASEKQQQTFANSVVAYLADIGVDLALSRVNQKTNPLSIICHRVDIITTGFSFDTLKHIAELNRLADTY